jgi:hypothetical protein
MAMFCVVTKSFPGSSLAAAAAAAAFYLGGFNVKWNTDSNVHHTGKLFNHKLQVLGDLNFVWWTIDLTLKRLCSFFERGTYNEKCLIV